MRRLLKQKVRILPKRSFLVSKLYFGVRSQYVAMAFIVSFLIVQLAGVMIFSSGVQAATNLTVTTEAGGTSASRNDIYFNGYTNDLARSLAASYSFDYGATLSYGSNNNSITRATSTSYIMGESSSTSTFGCAQLCLEGEGAGARLAVGGGYIYATSSGGGEAKIKKFNLNGAGVAIPGSWGTPGTGNGQFNHIQGIAVAPNGQVYVLDQYRVQRFTSTGAFISSWGSFGAGGGNEMLSPAGIAIDGAGNVYVADSSDNDIRKFAADGTFIAQWSLSESAYSPRYLTVAPDGLLHVLISDGTSSLVQRLNVADGSVAGSFFVGIGTYNALAVDIHGSSYVAGNTNQIRTYSSNGAELTTLTPTIFGSSAVFNPYGLAITPEGVLYVRNDAQGTVGLSASRYGVVGIRDKLSAHLYGLDCAYTLHVRIKAAVGADTVYGDDTMSATQACQTFAITTNSLPDGMAGSPYTTTIETNGQGGVAYSLAFGSLPDGLSLDYDTGEISGTPVVAGTYQIHILAEDLSGSGDSEEKTFNLIVAGDGSFVITTTSLPEGEVGVDYDQTIATDSSVSIVFSLASGSLPAGLSLSSAGAITGTPTTPGTSNFTVQATDGTNNDTQDLSIAVTEEPTIVDPEDPEPVDPVGPTEPLDQEVETPPELKLPSERPRPASTSSLKAPSITQTASSSLFALAKRIPEPIAIGFPWLLLASALVLVSIQYYQVHSEALATKRMQASVVNQQRLVDEQNNFVALSTHYLHTPLTIMEGEISLMVKAGTLSGAQATKLKATLASLNAEAEAVLAQEEQNEVTSRA